MYRFRSIENLLGKYQELENQEIYFASPEELNDPMEGYRDLFWKGDEIIWRNFIINYIKSIEHIFALTIILNDEKQITENDILTSHRLLGFKSPENKRIIEQIITMVFESEFIKDLPVKLASRTNPIRRNELLSYLQMFHPFIINSISEIYYKNKLTNKNLLHQDLDEFSLKLKESENIIGLVNKLESEHDPNVTEKFFTVTNMLSQSIKLFNKYNLSVKGISSNVFFIISEFPEKFLSKLESDIYPKWYSTSFIYDLSNSAIWGHYGDNHKGVCLMFRTLKNGEKMSINLNTEHGYSSSSGPIVSMQPHSFNKIKYTNKHIEIDFFRSIGRMTRHELNSIWYSDSEGRISNCGEHLNNNEDEWRKKYWQNFYDSITTKLNEWNYEQEYRLIIHGDLIDYSEKEKRKLKYDFNDIEGIIFGIKTPTSDKIKIIKIIESKCERNNRKEFDFYQAYYSKDSGKIESFKLSGINNK